MKVLIVTRADALTRRGGDTIQFCNYVRELQAAGVAARLETNPDASFAGADLIHIGGLDRVAESSWYAARARSSGIPTVISPIFHPPDRQRQYDGHGNRGGAFQNTAHALLPSSILDRCKALAYAARNTDLIRPSFRMALRGPHRLRLEVLTSAASWLLIARAEGRSLQEAFGVQPRATFLIPNGVPDDFLKWEETGERNGVLVVGRIEARKNQLAILRALRGTGVRITIAGAVNPYHRKYGDAVFQEIQGNPLASYEPETDHDRMKALYLRHRVHVSASWLEVAPLVDLEAAALGCAVVASKAGYTDEYLQNAARYIEPGDGIEAIRTAVLDALDHSVDLSSQSKEIARRYTWRNAAIQLADAYRETLDGSA